MRVTGVQLYRVWQHKPTGQRVSVFGAVPYVNDAERQDWETVTDGYTLRWDSGAVGCFHHPRPATEAEALDLMDRINFRITRFGKD